MQVDHSSSIPLHKQIEDYIRDLINTGEYDEGKLLPNEEDLAKQFGVARNTVRQGMYKLVMEGLIVRKKGVGTMVAPPKITTQLDEWHSFTREMEDRGVSIKNYMVNVKKVEADRKLAKILHIDEGRQIIRLERLRGNQESPFVFFISWFHPRVGLTGKENFSRPLYEILENDLSVIPTRSNEDLQAINVDEETADYLNIQTKDPVLYRKRKVYDTGNRIIEYNIGFYRSDRFTYSINIQRET